VGGGALGHGRSAGARAPAPPAATLLSTRCAKRARHRGRAGFHSRPWRDAAVAVHRRGFTALPAAACGGHSRTLLRALEPNPTMERISLLFCSHGRATPLPSRSRWRPLSCTADGDAAGQGDGRVRRAEGAAADAPSPRGAPAGHQPTTWDHGGGCVVREHAHRDYCLSRVTPFSVLIRFACFTRHASCAQHCATWRTLWFPAAISTMRRSCAGKSQLAAHDASKLLLREVEIGEQPDREMDAVGCLRCLLAL
jgi:hypothetical protein